jgi:hypothetical protein
MSIRARVLVGETQDQVSHPGDALSHRRYGQDTLVVVESPQVAWRRVSCPTIERAVRIRDKCEGRRTGVGTAAPEPAVQA